MAGLGKKRERIKENLKKVVNRPQIALYSTTFENPLLNVCILSAIQNN